jgi:hypothetical protein
VRVSLAVAKVTLTPTSLSDVIDPEDVNVILAAVTVLMDHVPLFPTTLAPVTLTFLPTTHPSVTKFPPAVST